MTERLGPTPSQTVGPFLSIGLDWPDGPDVVAPGTPGAFTIDGRLTDGAAEPIPDGLVEIWQADPDGRFGAGFRGFGRCATDADGRYRFRTLKPGRVDDVQAPHIDVIVLARGLLKHLVTRIYFPDEDATNAADPLLSGLDPDERARLTATADGDALRYDICLQGEGETPFFTV
jgi:protocatechuate 3,4-dioxygenase, alpha subunit